MTAMKDSEQRLWCTECFSFDPCLIFALGANSVIFPLEFSMGILQVKLHLNYRSHMNEIKVHQSCSTCGEVKNANKSVLRIDLREKKP